MRRRGVRPKNRRTAARNKSNVLRSTWEIAAAGVKPTPSFELPVLGDITIGAVDIPAILEFREDHNIGLVVTGAREQIGRFFRRIIGSARVGVAITAPHLETTEFFPEENVEHAGNSVGAVNGRST